jgi:hypothetical protein
VVDFEAQRPALFATRACGLAQADLKFGYYTGEETHDAGLKPGATAKRDSWHKNRAMVKRSSLGRPLGMAGKV